MHHDVTTNITRKTTSTLINIPFTTITISTAAVTMTITISLMITTSTTNSTTISTIASTPTTNKYDYEQMNEQTFMVVIYSTMKLWLASSQVKAFK